MLFLIFDPYNYFEIVLHFTDKETKTSELGEVKKLAKKSLS